MKPVVSEYPAASRAHLGGRSSLLCVASDMFPPLVRFSLKIRKEDGDLEELPHVEEEQLQLTESRCAAAILWIRQQDSRTSNYICSVQHEGGTVLAKEEGNESFTPGIDQTTKYLSHYIKFTYFEVSLRVILSCLQIAEM